MADFWNLIDRARVAGAPSAPSASPDDLNKILRDLPTKDVLEFQRSYNVSLIDLNRWDLWAAGYVIADGMGDDSFHYFRSWIIGKGRDCFNAAIRDPSSLIPFLDNLEVDNELLEYVALEVLEGRGVTEETEDEQDGHPDDEPHGEPFDEETVEEMYPGLVQFVAQFNKRSSRKSVIGSIQSFWSRFTSKTRY